MIGGERRGNRRGPESGQEKEGDGRNEIGERRKSEEKSRQDKLSFCCHFCSLGAGEVQTERKEGRVNRRKQHTIQIKKY